ncbi:MAG: hypothetical protein JO122_18665 [Acetobacteraceae bacterium]|nr:hypothetical protein [Acetobacteraceae bacterium]
MKTTGSLATVLFGCGFAFVPWPANGQAANEMKEVTLAAPNHVAVRVRTQAPYDAETPLQVVCYFKHKAAGDTTLEAAVDLDRKLGGVIASLRNRGEFVGDELETVLLSPPEGTIKPKLLLLVGLGDEASLSLDTMKGVGRAAVREAARLGVTRVAFAPLIRDQGSSRFAAGDVADAVVQGMLLGYDTEKRLQKEGLAKAFTLEEWVQEAGPKYFEDTVPGVRKAVKEATSAIEARTSNPYATRER